MRFGIIDITTHKASARQIYFLKVVKVTPDVKVTPVYGMADYQTLVNVIKLGSHWRELAPESVDLPNVRKKPHKAVYGT